ncbi:MAG TPA: hypothetical protein VN764_16690, partial [Polyangiaceae bacterium]|nr:hypothetical protein [Polyangiaceae bacterium]
GVSFTAVREGYQLRPDLASINARAASPAAPGQLGLPEKLSQMTAKMRTPLWVAGKTSWLAAALLLLVVTALTLWTQRQAPPTSESSGPGSAAPQAPAAPSGSCPKHHLPHAGVCLPLE